MTALGEALCVLVGGVFILAAASKVLTFEATAKSVWLPLKATQGGRQLVLVALILAETALGTIVAFQVLAPPTVFGLFVVSLILLSWYGTRSIRVTGSCSCFGEPRTSSETAASLYLRNFLLGTGGAVGLATSDGQGSSSPLGLMLSAVLPWLLLVLISVLVATLQLSGRGRTLIRRGRLLLRGRRAII